MVSGLACDGIGVVLLGSRESGLLRDPGARGSRAPGAARVESRGPGGRHATGSSLRAFAQAGAAALPHHPAFHFWAGTVLFFQEKSDEAVLALRRADRLDKTNFLIPTGSRPI